MKLFLRIVAAVAALVLVVIVAGVAWLIYPGEPSPSRVLRFERYVLLPRHGLLNVLDYMSVEGHSLYVGGTSAGSVIRVDLGRPDLPVTEWRGGDGRVHGVAVAGSLGLAFATRSETNAVDVFSPSRLTRIGRIAVPDDPDAILYDPRHNLIYVANGDAGLATLIDPSTKTKIGTIALGGKPEFAVFDPHSGLVYQSIESSAELAAVDLGKRRVVGRWPVRPCDGPTGLAIDAVLRRAFIVCGKNAMLVVFDLDRNRIVASVKIGMGPDAVAFDPGHKRIYATGLGGQVSVTAQLGADSYRNLDIVSTHFAAHTLAVDPSTHRLYVGYASLVAPPRIAVFSAAE
jgi:YVTN family beta-propeller protein